jgi:hypothetical protein
LVREVAYSVDMDDETLTLPAKDVIDKVKDKVAKRR